jgi:hypothetical protein
VASIVDLLVKLQILDERQHDAVLSRSKSSAGGHIVQQVAEMGYATEGTVARAISVELGLPRIDLAITPPEPLALALLDARTCTDRFVLPVALRENGELLWLAMADPTDQDSIGVVRRKTMKRVRPAVAGPTEILRAARSLYAVLTAGTSQPEGVSNEKLAAIEIENEEQGEVFQVLNVAEDLGETSASKKLDATVRKAKPKETGGQPRPLTFDELFSLAAEPAPVSASDLTEEDLSMLEALQSSMEKAALVLRATAELCVEKGLFTREEMRKAHTQGSSS